MNQIDKTQGDRALLGVDYLMKKTRSFTAVVEEFSLNALAAAEFNRVLNEGLPKNDFSLGTVAVLAATAAELQSSANRLITAAELLNRRAVNPVVGFDLNSTFDSPESIAQVSYAAGEAFARLYVHVDNSEDADEDTGEDKGDNWDGTDQDGYKYHGCF